MSRSSIWSVVIGISCVAIGLLVLLAAESPVRTAIGLWFVFVCPGMAYVRLLQVDTLLTELSLAVGLSIAFDTIVGMALLYSGLWSPDAALVILIVVSLVGAALPWSPGEPRVMEKG